jgi:predicted  nucleic acid-binding Zn ribbon protein
MQIVELMFQSKAIGDEEVDMIDTLIAHWRHRGQVLGREHLIARARTKCRVTVMLPELCSLNDEFDSIYAANAREKLRAVAIAGPTIRPKEPQSPGSAPCVCAAPSHYVLYTTYVRLGSCLSCGDCFQPVPLYRVPYEESTPAKGALHDRLMNWQSNYQACDHLQMNCQVGEKFGLREMGRHDSALARQGREICRDIARLTGIATYYYLHRYLRRARPTVEQQRRCPGCNGHWRLPEQQHLFHFKCDACRLLSCMSP